VKKNWTEEELIEHFTFCSRLHALLESTIEKEHDGWTEEKKEDIFSFRYLLSSLNKPSVNTIKEEIKKLLAIRHLQIPDSLCKQVTLNY
jgi:hypothetical protein